MNDNTNMRDTGMRDNEITDRNVTTRKRSETGEIRSERMEDQIEDQSDTQMEHSRTRTGAGE